MISIYHIGFILFSLVAFFVLYQATATLIDQYRYPPTGRRVDIGGYKLHINKSGEGKIAAICDAGLSGTSLGWTLVLKEVSKFARVCSFDRAGYGWSDPSPLKRTSINIAKELNSVLEKAEIPGPYILVGHSFGGANMLVFADLYPEQTLGVILVDSVHEDLSEKLPDPPQSYFERLMSFPSVQWTLDAVGYKRLKGPSSEIKQMFIPLPEHIQKAYIAQMNKANYGRTVSQEMDCFDESLSQLRKCKQLNKPLIVISAGIFSNQEEGKIWNELQKDLLTKSSKSRQIIAEKSDHMINHYQPQIIVDAIKEMMDGLIFTKN